MMKLLLCLLAATSVWAIEDGSRARRPVVVDAIGNTLPPPSNVPATVGSPVNLLTPDRYEFYTFDESGELVKRLMTLEEIQAIVAAGEEAEGLVTFANDNQPTMGFNFSQPTHTKVHNVVTNVQNVLKAQMEAHKNNPMVQPTLDTPDVSDSWSLILPSIFGNTGLDIVPDKVSSAVTPPETDTLELRLPETDEYFSKEGNNNIFNKLTTTKYIEPIKRDQTTISTTIFEDKISTSPTTISTEAFTTTTKTPLTTTPKVNTNGISTETTIKIKTTQKPIATKIPSKQTTVKESITKFTSTKEPVKQTTKIPIKQTTAKTPIKTTTKKIPAKITTTKEPVKYTTLKDTTELTTQKEQYANLTTIKDILTKTTTFTKIPIKSTTPKNIHSTKKYYSTTSRPPLTSAKKNITTTTKSSQGTSTTPRETASSITQKISLTTQKISSTTPKISSTTQKTVTKSTPKITTSKPLTTKTPFTTVTNIKKKPEIDTVQSLTNEIITETNSVQYDTNNSFVPISTASYITERTTQKQYESLPTVSASLLNENPKTTTSATVSPTTFKNQQPVGTTSMPTVALTNAFTTTAVNSDVDNMNSTTITTQSVSPSTTVSSTEFISVGNKHFAEIRPILENIDNDNKESDFPMFDVAQSISQIASDLGGNYMPVPTVSNVVDTTKNNGIEMESKESFDLDIFNDNDTNIKKSNISDTNTDNFVKISTFDPNDRDNGAENKKDFTNIQKITDLSTTEKSTSPITIIENTSMDKVLSESMGDLLFQIVNENPTIQENENKDQQEVTTIELIEESTTNQNLYSTETTTEVAEKIMILHEQQEKSNRSELNPIANESTTTLSTKTFNNPIELNSGIVSTENPLTMDSSLVSIQLFNRTNSTAQTQQEIALPTKKTDSIASGVSTTTIATKYFTNAPSTETSIFDEVKDKDNKMQTNTVEVTTVSKFEKNANSFPKLEEFKKKFQKVNIDDKELANERNNSWKLISTVSPPKSIESPKDKIKTNGNSVGDFNSNKEILLEISKENQGLEVTTKDLEEDLAKFSELCNELAFRYWNTMVESIDKRRSFVLSPYAVTSMLAMMFMGARGSTSGEMNDILKLDDMVTFNPHFTLKNISDSIETTPDSGVMVSAFIRELYSDKNKGKILTFYKERAQHFYSGHVEEVNYNLISDIIRRRTNMLVKRLTWGKVAEYIKSNTITMHPPLAAFSANIFQTDCTGSSVEGRDGEMYFVVSPGVRQRRLIPVPAVVYRNGFLAGYDPVLDATAAALGNTNSVISTLFVMPGQQGNVVHATDLEALEQRLLEANPTTPSWNRLLRTLLPRIGLELQIPRFSHKSIFNVSSTLKNMGLKDLFDAEHADLGGLNGPSKDLYLSDMIQSTTFVTCGEGAIGEQHHIEEYPESLEGVARRRSSRWTSDWAEPRDYQRAFHDPHDVGEAMHLPLHLRPRQARLPARNAQPARLKFDRPFLYFVRHNPTGMILYVGRYNPRLLP